LCTQLKKNRWVIAKCLIDHGIEISKDDLKEQCLELLPENVDIMEYFNKTLKQNKRKRNNQGSESLKASDMKKIKH